MQRNRPYFVLSILVGLLLILRFSGFNLGQEMQPTNVAAPDDIASWANAVYVLDGAVLTKLNDQLEVVKSVPLPLSPVPVPVPPEPIPQVSSPATESAVPQQIPVSDEMFGGRLSADSQKVCVLHEGVIYVFDHDLNFLLSAEAQF